MSRPPMKAVEQIKNYCNKTQCRRCAFGIVEDCGEEHGNYVGCDLQYTNPCDWDTDRFKCSEQEKSNG